MAVALRYFTDFGKPAAFQHITASICGGIYARVLYVIVRVRCRKKISRSISHLLICFLLFHLTGRVSRRYTCHMSQRSLLPGSMLAVTSRSGNGLCSIVSLAIIAYCALHVMHNVHFITACQSADKDLQWTEITYATQLGVWSTDTRQTL